MSYYQTFCRYTTVAAIFPVLTLEDEKILCCRYYENKSAKDLDLLVKHNIRLVLDFVQSFIHDEEFLCEGMLGLVAAAKRFDPTRGNRFSTFAMHYIKGYIYIASMNNHRLVKVGTTEAQKRIFYNINKVKARLTSRSIELTPENIAQELQVSSRDVEQMEQRMEQETRLDAPIEGDQDSKQLDLLTFDGADPEEAFEQEEAKQVLAQKILQVRGSLNQLEKRILDVHLTSDQEKKLSFRDIGEQVGYSHEYVRKTMERMKPKFRMMAE